MIHQLNEIFQISAATLLLLTCLLLLTYYKRGMHTWAGIGFTLCIVCYLIIENDFVRNTQPLYIIVVTGAICIPVFFWILAKAIFDDHFKPSPSTALWFLVQIIPHAHIYFSNSFQFSEHILHVIAEITSIGFILAGLYTALKTRQADLIDSRLHFRNIFIVITATLIGLTLIVEATPLAQHTTTVLQLLQRASILFLSLYFLISNIELRPGFFFKEHPKPKPVTAEDPLLLEQLQKLLNEQQIYKKEGLTIRELAELMNEQEYRLRKLINGQLGFKNFNDFINQYRIKEACTILADPAQNRKTILEIAYNLGYQSIGPFNKAFKELKGVTPTAYRKQQQQQ